MVHEYAYFFINTFGNRSIQADKCETMSNDCTQNHEIAHCDAVLRYSGSTGSVVAIPDHAQIVKLRSNSNQMHLLCDCVRRR